VQAPTKFELIINLKTAKELKAAAALVKQAPRVELPRNARRRNAMLLALVAAGRRGSAALVEQLRWLSWPKTG
jgi:type II secretory pathway predicted ATPase ExeA